MQRSDHSGSRRRFLEVAERLLQAIAAGELQPGDKLLPERELATHHGVSRATAREALLALEVGGAVDIQHGNGVFVRGPAGQSHSQLMSRAMIPRELLEARLALEPCSVRVAANLIPIAAIRSLREDIALARKFSDDPNDLQEFVTTSFRFHRTLAQECGNRLVASAVTDLVDTDQHPLWNLINQQASRTREAREQQLLEHSMILDALEARDPNAACVAMENHIRAIGDSIFVR